MNQTPDTQEILLRRIRAKEARIAVIGLGYVGLPLAVAFAEQEFPVTGLEVDLEKVEALKTGRSYVADIPSRRLRDLPPESFVPTSDPEALSRCDVALICVPTPLGKTRDPDVSYLLEAGRVVSEFLHPGVLVCLESTTYPGTTEELIQPMLEQKGLQVGKDFFLAFSPERIDPGRVDYTVESTPKVVGGVTPACLTVATVLYGQITSQVVPVSSTRAAEMVKLLENTFRAVNIALVNEVALMCDKLGIDVWEVVEAAATKPYGFMKFSPGPGVGGHCIPLDPHYLSWKLKTLHYNARFIQLAGEINSEMPRYWADKAQDALNQAGKAVNGSRILVLGVAYKKGVNDVRESPALDIIELLRSKGADTRYHDPYILSIAHNGHRMTREADLNRALSEADCVIIVTDHDAYDWQWVLRRARLLIDTRNVTKELTQPTVPSRPFKGVEQISGLTP